MHNPKSVLENETHKLLWDFEIQTDHLISPRRSVLQIISNNNNNNKKRTCRIVNFAVPVDHRVKLKENEKKDKYLDLAREMKKKKLWDMKVMVMSNVIGALRTVTKGLIQGLEDLEIRGRVETIQTTALLRSTRILRRVPENCCHSNSSEKPSVKAGVENSEKEYNNNSEKD